MPASGTAPIWRRTNAATDATGSDGATGANASVSDAGPTATGPTVWLGLDAFGRAVLEAGVAGTLEQSPHPRDVHAGVTADALDDDLRDRLLRILGGLLERMSTDRGRPFAVVHLWVVYALDSPVADAVPAWLAETLRVFDAVPIQAQVHILTVAQTWGPPTAERLAVRDRLRRLEERVVVAGQPGHSRVIVFLVTDRDYLAYKIPAAACWAAATHFAAFVVLTDAPRSTSQPVSAAFVPPSTTPWHGHGSAAGSNGAGDWPADVLGPFTGVAAAHLTYPVDAIWAQRTACHHGQLFQAMEEEPPADWQPDAPDPLALGAARIDAIPDGRVGPHVPLWTPHHPFGRRNEWWAVERLMDGWALQAKQWAEDERDYFLTRWEKMREQGAVFRAAYAAADREAQRVLLRDVPYDGVFRLIERYLEQSGARLEEARTTLAGNGVDELERPAPARPVARPDVPATPPLDGFLGEAKEAIAAGIARRINLGQLAAVAVVTGFVAWLLIGEAVVSLPFSLVGAYDRFAESRGLPRPGVISSVLDPDPALARLLVALAVVVGVGGFWWMLASRTRRRQEELFNEWFYEVAEAWKQEVGTRLATALADAHESDVRHTLAALATSVGVRGSRLAQLRAYGADAPRPTMPVPGDHFDTVLGAGRADRAQLTPDTVRTILRLFRRTETALGWNAPDVAPGAFFDDLHRLTGHVLGEARPSLRHDLAELVPDIRRLVPAAEDVLILPAAADDRRSWIVTSMIAVPVGLQPELAPAVPSAIVLGMPLEERVYGITIRQGLRLQDVLPVPEGAAALSEVRR